MSANPKIEFTFEALADGQLGRISLEHPVLRFAGNPILTCHDVNRAWRHPALMVKTTHNAGVVRFQDHVVMLFRAHLRNGISVIGLARSRDGLGDWHIDPQPALVPCNKDDRYAEGVDPKQLIENEGGGVEDPRITQVDDTYYITYSAYHATLKDRVRVSLATTTDFARFCRHGAVCDADMRNVVIFPKRFGDKYVGLFRPNDRHDGGVGGAFAAIRLATTGHLESNHWVMADKPLFKTAGGPSAFSDKIGPGAPPIRTPYGWINIFHGVRNTMDGNPYVLGVALHDLDDPQIVKVSAIPILFPTRADCVVSDNDYVHVPNVVFTCGEIPADGGGILIYYGGSDTVMNVGWSHADVLAALCEQFPMDVETGRPSYDIRGR